MAHGTKSETVAGPEQNAQEANGADAIVRHVIGPFTWRNAVGWLAIIGIFLAVRWLLLDAYYIPSKSMEPTLHGDEGVLRRDYILVNKAIYGPRVPFTNKRLFSWRDPKRWDIVVFHSVERDPTHKTLIKRVVGLPGEIVSIRGGRVYVNGEAVEPPESTAPVTTYTRTLEPTEREIQNYLDERQTDSDDEDTARKDFIWRYRGLKPFRYAVLNDYEYSVVPPDSYFVLGDNSAASIDSRYYGWVPGNNILGRAEAIAWPVTHWRDLSGFSSTWTGTLVLVAVPAVVAAYLAKRKFAGSRN